MDPNVKGIPDFWYTIFKNVSMLSEMMQEHDEPILKTLLDIKRKNFALPTLYSHASTLYSHASNWCERQRLQVQFHQVFIINILAAFHAYKNINSSSSRNGTSDHLDCLWHSVWICRWLHAVVFFVLPYSGRTSDLLKILLQKRKLSHLRHVKNRTNLFNNNNIGNYKML